MIFLLLGLAVTALAVYAAVNPGVRRLTFYEGGRFTAPSIPSLPKKSHTSKDFLRLTGIGGCQRVGASCFLLETPELKILLDCGIDNSNTGPPVQYFVDPREIDLIILSHAHMDHSGWIPWLYRHGCRAPLIATRETLAICKILWEDSIKLGNTAYDKSDVEITLSHAYPVGYNDPQSFGRDDLKIELKQAGHILGAACVEIEYKDKKILYTGDISVESFTVPECFLKNISKEYDHVICEGTYGGVVRDISLNDEARNFVRKVLNALDRGGIVLIPSFAVGRGQDIQIVLLDPQFGFDPNQYKIYIGGMIKDINQIYSSVANENGLSDPLSSEKIHWIKGDEWIDLIFDGEPKVLILTSGMLEGLSRIVFGLLAPDPKNFLAIVGHQAIGTFGRSVLDLRNFVNVSFEVDATAEKLKKRLGDLANKYIIEELGEKVLFKLDDAVRIQIEQFSFSAHADQKDILDLFSKVKVKNFLLVHGESSNLAELKKSIETNLDVEKVRILMQNETIFLMSDKDYVVEKMGTPAYDFIRQVDVASYSYNTALELPKFEMENIYINSMTDYEQTRHEHFDDISLRSYGPYFAHPDLHKITFRDSFDMFFKHSVFDDEQLGYTSHKYLEKSYYEPIPMRAYLHDPIHIHSEVIGVSSLGGAIYREAKFQGPHLIEETYYLVGHGGHKFSVEVVDSPYGGKVYFDGYNGPIQILPDRY